MNLFLSRFNTYYLIIIEWIFGNLNSNRSMIIQIAIKSVVQDGLFYLIKQADVTQ